ncbi:MFS transporter [Marivita sp.]|uniref:MFS transporter n=1 Tax=Marivita sp. TaxID=2003365 RepID=UPI00260D0BEF|nr:MFS transporter [Marivita sp.]
MRNRWTILAVLFLARTAMGFQFQSIGALSPLLVDSYGLSLADIGFLIGLYLAPGVVVAIPGGAIAGRFGDKRIVGLSMGLMFLGSVLIAWAPTWGLLVTGRLLAGVGGVALNVVMTKMVIDWFVGREISTAMSIFINSWPLGIALALFALPIISANGGLQLAWITVLASITVALIAFVLIYQPADTATEAVTEIKITSFPVYPLLLAGTAWALSNAALAMVFSFGPALLTERGLGLTTASALISAFMLCLAIAIPIGGVLADRSGKRDAVITFGLSSFVVLAPVIMYAPIAIVPAAVLIFGFLSGLCFGPIVGMPATILPPQSRAFAMGVYFTIYYVAMMGAPVLAGALADYSQTLQATWWFGVVLVVVSIVSVALFHRAERSAPAKA